MLLEMEYGDLGFQAVPIQEVWEEVVKREKLVKENNTNFQSFGDENSTIYEKNKEYIKRFVNEETTFFTFLENLTKDLTNPAFIEIREKSFSFRGRFILCKLMDLAPETYEDACELIPEFSEIYGKRESKFLFRVLKEGKFHEP